VCSSHDREDSVCSSYDREDAVCSSHDREDAVCSSHDREDTTCCSHDREDAVTPKYSGIILAFWRTVKRAQAATKTFEHPWHDTIIKYTYVHTVQQFLIKAYKVITNRGRGKKLLKNRKCAF
jgi:hypothetical protein